MGVLKAHKREVERELDDSIQVQYERFYTSILNFMGYSCKVENRRVNKLETPLNELEKVGKGEMDGDNEKGVPSCAQTPIRYKT